MFNIGFILEMRFPLPEYQQHLRFPCSQMIIVNLFIYHWNLLDVPLITLFNSGYRVSEETHHAQSILFTVINLLSYFNLIILIYFTLFGIYKIISDSVPTANSLYHLECHLQLLQPSLASYELCIRSELHYI